jgi:hypothetical protein
VRYYDTRAEAESVAEAIGPKLPWPSRQRPEHQNNVVLSLNWRADVQHLFRPVDMLLGLGLMFFERGFKVFRPRGLRDLGKDAQDFAAK